MALTTANSFLPESESDEDRELARRASLEAAYRREHAAYVAQGKPDRAAAVVAAALSELGVSIEGGPDGERRRTRR